MSVDRQRDVLLSGLTTLRLGGPAGTLQAAHTTDELVDAVRGADAAGEDLLLLAGGSNLVIADEGFAGPVVHVLTRGLTAQEHETSVRLTVAAGEPWDAVVAHCVTAGYGGVECLSGIPGSTGATPIQNVGAYGQEVAETVIAVRVHDRHTDRVVTLDAADCGFAYRDSMLKGSGRHVVLDVTFLLPRSPLGAPVAYAELARALNVTIGERAPLGDVRDAVLALRRSKGMVVDPADPDSVSAGSFFTNPVLDEGAFTALMQRAEARLGPDDLPPRFPAEGGQVKTSAAWLIQRAGFAPGYARGAVAVSSKHTLALTNRGGASTAELLALAREIRDGVQNAFGVRLVNEPVLVGAKL